MKVKKNLAKTIILVLATGVVYFVPGDERRTHQTSCVRKVIED